MRSTSPSLSRLPECAKVCPQLARRAHRALRALYHHLYHYHPPHAHPLASPFAPAHSQPVNRHGPFHLYIDTSH